jgi:hypothetical protein
MRRLGATILLGALAVGLAAGVVEISRFRVVGEPQFPPYSSLRTQRDGTKVLADSLALLPGFMVERGLSPVAALDALPARLIVFAGIEAQTWRDWDEADVAALDRAIRSGGRVVFAFRPSAIVWSAAVGQRCAASRTWQVDLAMATNPATDSEGSVRAVRAPVAPEALPRELEWKDSFVFVPDRDAGWHTVFTRGGEPVILERTIGRGTIVLVADATGLTNGALAERRETRLLAWLVGDRRQIYIDETHLGLDDRPGIAALARRYGLTSAFVLTVVAAALFVWRRWALFVATPSDSATPILEYGPTAGLENLLRRALKPRDLAGVCLREWRAAGEPGRLSAEPISDEPGAGASVQVYNALRAKIRRR